MQQTTNWLNKKSQWVTVIFAGFMAFATYTSMYMFRKPFTVADYSQQLSVIVDYKVWLVVAQVLGYMASKFYGIKFIAQLKKERRLQTIIVLISIAWLSLLLFAVVPLPVKPLCMILNGFPLGMIWGLVFSYIEGRKATELIGAILASSFIFASGFAKSIGKWLMAEFAVSVFWMPFYAASIFIIPLFIFAKFLNALPPPNDVDIASRTLRLPMTKVERKAFLQKFSLGLVLIIVVYIAITILRDVRDNFMVEIFSDLQQKVNAATFSTTEIPIALSVLAITGFTILIRQNKKAFLFTHVLIILGLVFALVGTLLFLNKSINPLLWMIITGFGLYLSYIPINCIFFERLIATYAVAANVGFVMYIADAFGYLGSIGILFVKEFLSLQLNWANFFANLVIWFSIFSIVLVSFSFYYFKNKKI